MNRNVFLADLKLFALVLVAVASAAPSFAASYDLVAKEFTKAIDGESITMWGFALDTGQDCAPTALPEWEVGPVLTDVAGTTLTITLRNCLNEPVSLVIPGQNAVLSPVWIDDSGNVVATGSRPEGDVTARVRSFTVEAPDHGSAVYTWTDIAPGTFLYQSGSHPAKQVQMGLYGALTVEGYPGVPFDSEATLLYSEIDPALHDPPSAAKPLNYKPRYFLVNGYPYPGAEPVLSTPLNSGERVLIRLLNAGLKPHTPTLLNGPYLEVIAEDGNPYPFPRRQYSMLLAPGKTLDAVWDPTAPGEYALYDRSLYLTSGGVSGGGMLTRLIVAGAAGSPVAIDDGYRVNEGTTLNVAAPGVLANDLDDGPLSVTADSPIRDVGGGTLTLNANGSFEYTPAPGTYSDYFTYKAGDGSLDSNAATVTLTVNHAPVAVADSASTVVETPVIIDILANDSDSDGDALTANSVTDPRAVVNPDNTVTFTPAPGDASPATFTYAAFDGLLGSAPATVTIEIVPALNQAPVAIDDFATVVRNSPATFINLTGNDNDADGAIDPSSIVVTTGTTTTRGGTVTVVTGGVNYTPKRNFRGTDTFNYTVDDNDGATSNEAMVRVNVVRP